MKFKNIKQLEREIKKIQDNYEMGNKEEWDKEELLEAKLSQTKEIVKMIEEWEGENTEVLTTEDIIKKKIVIADYVKWDKIREILAEIKGDR